MKLSKYSTEIRYIVESGYNLGLMDYEIFSEEYRTKLNDKILKHYYFHEIGFETVDRFKHYINTTMNEIMPLYNQLLKSELISINPLLTFERVSNSSKISDSSTKEDFKNDVTKSVDNTIVKNVNNTTNQNINNTTSLDNTTLSSTDETQSKNNDTTQGTNATTNKNIDGTNINEDSEIFYDTPNGTLGDITSTSRATSVTKKDGATSIDENENLSTNEDIIKNEDGTTVIDSDSLNTTNTDTTSVTDNETINSIDEDTTASTDEIVANISDNTKLTNLNENNIITENGFEIPLSELILKYRATFLNVDLQIINDLKDLFMMIY